MFTVAQDTIHFYVIFIINLVFLFIIYLILVNVFFFKCHTCLVDMKFCKHVLNLQKKKVNYFPCRSCLGEIGIMTISMNFVPVFEERK
jgi:hypothetical protein